MNAFLVRLGCFFLLACACTFASAQPVAGKEYLVLDPPRAVKSDRIEVLEFFYYGCPVCYEAQPHIARWQLAMGPSIELKRVPAVSQAWVSFARESPVLSSERRRRLRREVSASPELPPRRSRCAA